MYQQFTNVYSATEVILIVGLGHLYAVFSRTPARKRPGSLPKAGRGGCYNILRQLLYFEGEFCDRCYTFPASIMRQKLYFRSISVPFLPNCTGWPRVWWAFCDRTYTGTGILRLFLYFPTGAFYDRSYTSRPHGISRIIRLFLYFWCPVLRLLLYFPAKIYTISAFQASEGHISHALCDFYYTSALPDHFW